MDRLESPIRPGSLENLPDFAEANVCKLRPCEKEVSLQPAEASFTLVGRTAALICRLQTQAGLDTPDAAL